ncbi:hypothetical protein OPQ81_002402 [Rhizoctonia solani]|nr:hypothetical protein OPQ81_002402 [Rhizoctonia solani]
MAAPALQPPALDQTLGTPAAEWAQETVEAIDPNASTGVVTDASGNPTTDHSKSALAGEPGYGVNSEKTAAQLQIQRSIVQPVFNDGSAAHSEKTPTNERPQTEPAPKVYTDAQGNPTTDSRANALSSAPGTGQPIPSAVDKSLPPTPAQQLPGGWIRGPESRQHSVIIPETSLYEDVSEALGTVGRAAFSALPASVVGSLSNGNPQGGADGNAGVTQAQAPAISADSKPDSSTPRSASPGILSRAQDMITGFLGRPASPATKLPVPNAPTTTGDAALVGGGAVADTANKHGENIAAGQDLGGHNPKGVKETEQTRLENEGSGNIVSSEGANTASQFLSADVPTPDPTQPPKEPDVTGSLFPILPDDGKNSKNKGSKSGSGSHDANSQSASGSDRPQPTVTKVSDSGVKEILMDVKDMVAAPFAGSRASQELSRPSDSGSPGSPGKTVTSLSPADLALGANPEGIRTTANPHTAHTGLPPTKEEASDEHVGATPVIGDSSTVAKSTQPAATDADHKKTTSSTGHKKSTSGASQKEVTPSASQKVTIPSADQKERTAAEGESTHAVSLQGISSHGDGQGAIYATEDGALSQRSAPAINSTSPPGSPNKGVSRLWSRSRRSVDEGTTATKSTTRSKFTEEPSSTGSETGSAPNSPSSSRFKVPLKDKIKGELKIISGKMSRNEAKVEQGVALKSGQDPHSPTTHKH